MTAFLSIRPANRPKHYLRFLLWFGLAAVIIYLVPQTVAAQQSDLNRQIEDRLKGAWGQIKVNLRYRYERVDQDGLKTANGDPLRLRLGYLSPKLSIVQAFVEFEGNTPVFFDDYNDKSNGKTEYAVIADPSEAEINQAWIALDTIGNTILRAGRQKILLDNQRFVGAVGWRQMEQTFDALNLFTAGAGDLACNLFYIWNVRTILSTDVKMSSPMANLQYNLGSIGKLSGYGYWLDYDDPDNSGPFDYAFSTQTYGLRFNGKAKSGTNLALLYTAEAAMQSDYQHNQKDYTASYYHLVAGTVWPSAGRWLQNLTAKIGYEVLGSDKGVSFKTPLGTNHGFNGWADIFLTAPPQGLRDLYLALGGLMAGIKADLIYHDFRSDSGSSDYGSEINAMLTRKIGRHYTIQAVYANYSADEYKSDTAKFWLQFTAVF